MWVTANLPVMHALTTEIETLEAVEQVPVLGQIALKGQATLIYAPRIPGKP
jgi:hypothetical protein